MRTTMRILITLLASAMLVMPGTAAAAELPQPEWEASYNASADASGVFAPGVDLRVISRTEQTGQSLYLIVRTDGSLDGERTDSDGMDRIRCVRVDRCWAQSATRFGDVKWHRLPAGSVTYMDARAYWNSEVMAMPWPENALYGIESDDTGRPMHMVAMGSPGIYLLAAETTFEPGVAQSVLMLETGETLLNATVTAAVPASGLAAVQPPTKRQLGRPSTEPHFWTVPINPPAA
jgi:hypothetical protein